MSPEKEKEVEAKGDWRQKGEDSQMTTAVPPPATFFAASCSSSRDWGAGPATSACWIPTTLPSAAACSNDPFALSMVPLALTVGALLVP